MLVLAGKRRNSAEMHTPPTHTSTRQFLVSATRDTPAHRLMSTMVIRWVADRVEVRFAAVELPASKPSGLLFGMAARRRMVGR